ncbi:hypothetical protein BsWGS_19336 [Bradybaena similaris]
MIRLNTDQHKKRTGVLKLATWNVRTLSGEGKLANVKQELEREKINILGMCETRWKGTGIKTDEEFKIIYSGGEERQRGVAIILDRETSKSVQGYWAVSDRVLLVKLIGRPFNINIIQIYAPTGESSDDSIEEFYNDIESALKKCKDSEITIIMGDFNAKVGNQGDGCTVGNHGLGERNERGYKLVEWAKEQEMIVGNTWFQQHPRRLWTWRSPDGKTRNQIDYILISRRFRNMLTIAKTVPNADCYSDHRLITGTVRIKLKKVKYITANTKYDKCTLRDDKEIQNKFNIEVKNRFDVLSDLEILFQDVDASATRNKWKS